MSLKKLFQALHILKPGIQATLSSEDVEITEEDFNKIEWTIGEENGIAITTTTNPHPEITWLLAKAEMDKL